MKKRGLALLMALVLGLSLAGCTKDDKTAEKKEEELKDTDVVFSYDDPSEYITIPEDYIGIHVSGAEDVSDQEIQEQIMYARLANMKTEQIKEGTVQDGDTVYVFSTGSLQGEEKPFDSAEYEITIGSGEMIAGYEEGLIGANVGDTVTLNLTFPEDYGVEELNGEKAVFQVKIEYIYGENYMEEWTDEFVQEITDGKIKNTKDYEAALKKELQSDKEQEAYYEQQSEIINYLVKNSTVHKFPEGLVESQYDSYIETYEQENEENYGYKTLEEYILAEENFSDMEEFYDYIQECAENTATEVLAYQAIAYKEDISLTKAEYDRYLQRFASTQGYSTAKKFEEDFMSVYKEKDENFLKKRFLNEKVYEFLYENAVKGSDGDSAEN